MVSRIVADSAWKNLVEPATPFSSFPSPVTLWRSVYLVASVFLIQGVEVGPPLFEGAEQFEAQGG